DGESKSTVSPIATSASSGVWSPAMQSRRVVLPAPDAPNRMVKPEETWNLTLRVKEDSRPGRERKVLRIAIHRSSRWGDEGEFISIPTRSTRCGGANRREPLTTQSR